MESISAGEKIDCRSNTREKFQAIYFEINFFTASDDLAQVR